MDRRRFGRTARRGGGRRRRDAHCFSVLGGENRRFSTSGSNQGCMTLTGFERWIYFKRKYESILFFQVRLFSRLGRVAHYLLKLAPTARRGRFQYFTKIYGNEHQTAFGMMRRRLWMISSANVICTSLLVNTNKILLSQTKVPAPAQALTLCHYVVTIFYT